MLDSQDFYADVYEVWTENVSLMSAAKERETLAHHEGLYRSLVDALDNHSKKRFVKDYPELDLTTDEWRDFLWEKRPFSRHIVDAIDRMQAESFDKKLADTYREWLSVREQVLSSNVRLVLKVAHQHHDAHLEFLDLVQEGQFGLIRALERFDSAQTWRFSTYATHWVTQFIRLAIKKQTRTVSVPTNVQDRLSRYRRAVVQSQQRTGRRTRHDEVAELADTDVEDLVSTLALGMPIRSLNEPLGDEEGDQTSQDLLAASTESPEVLTEETERKEQVRAILDSLSHRERIILEMRYGIDMPQAYGYREIADQLKLSRERVRQIEAETLSRLALPPKRSVYEPRA